jgi:hypothetical protein
MPSACVLEGRGVLFEFKEDLTKASPGAVCSSSDTDHDAQEILSAWPACAPALTGGPELALLLLRKVPGLSKALQIYGNVSGDREISR